ncbi:MAG: tRNA-uridine aminocarboxypropyltransferase [Planctomycetota bacterium]|nr:tRNA-uridine aminocarboxypropyltransferase [Planctomycetota bacterium]
MQSRQVEESARDSLQDKRCYHCFRPRGDCFCESIPSIANKTEVLILQHVRERFHAFNTARIVQRALQNSRLLVDHNDRLAEARLPLKPHAGLLYPGPGGELISDLPAHRRPRQLIVLDGTWHHAKTMYRDIAALRELPCYRLAPTAPGRYRIRREPTDTSLSTLEATVAALRVLEPETAGLEQLLEAFEHMIDRQIAHPKSADGWRHNRKRNRTRGNIPRALLDGLDSIVVAYGESVSADGTNNSAARMPVYWVAQHISTGRRFAHLIEPAVRPSETLLGHWELSREDFTSALSVEEFRDRWAHFLGDGNILVTYRQSTARLLENIGARRGRGLVLKSVNLDPRQRGGTLEERLAAEGLTNESAQLPAHDEKTRAGKRLAMAVTLVKHMARSRPEQEKQQAGSRVREPA